MTLTFQELVDKFLKGETSGVSGGSGSLKIRNNQLIHYDTVIAERSKNTILLNITRYSLQTGRLQKIIREAMAKQKFTEIRMVPKNYRESLVKFVDKDN